MERGPVVSGDTQNRSAAVRGVMLGLAAYLIWGLAPMLFHALGAVPPVAILAHRVIWSVALLAGVVALQGRWGEFRGIFRHGRVLGALAVTTVLIGINWYTFIWSILNGVLMDASLGYFLMPLASALLGVIFLRERFRPWQAAALALAVIGVGWIIWSAGRLSWVALILMGSFAVYGLVRKVTPVGAIVSVLFETLMLLPFALAVAAWHLRTPERPPLDAPLMAGLICTALATGVPLLLFTLAVKVLRLSTIGFLQFLSPTCQFLLAVAFGEPLHWRRLAGFAVIWSACGIYLADSWMATASAEATAEGETAAELSSTCIEG